MNHVKASEDRPLLEVRNLNHRFQGLKALTDVSFSIQRGEVVGLIGPNGSGKTTILNVITGIYPVQRGAIHFKDRDLSIDRRHERVSKGIVRTFQEPRCFGNLQLLAHPIVSACATAPGPNRGETWRRLLSPWRRHSETGRNFLTEVRLDGDEERLASSVPYGHRRVLELARCLGPKPSLLLLDEPTAGLNSQETKDFTELLANVVKVRHTALIVIDHDMDFILGLCSRLLVLERGQLIFDGDASLALRDPKVVEAYFGEQPC